MAKVQESQIDHTVKLLVRLHDGKEVEAVIINHLGDPFSVVDGMCRGQRATLCLSSQARCSRACGELRECSDFCWLTCQSENERMWSEECTKVD